MSDLFFAWVTETDTTWNETFQRKDEDIAEISGEHSENNFCTVDVTIKNPRVGLLAPGRYVWCWMAYQADDTAGTVTPFFHGQLDAIPDDILGEAVTLHFIGKPIDFNAQKMAVAVSMKTAPEYDPIFVREELRPSLATDGTMAGDPDVVLEGWPKVWDINRVTGEVSATHILTGEDGTEEFQANEIPRASVQIHRGQAPLTGITVVGKVPWTQAGSGPGIDFGIKSFDTYNGLDIASSWPKTGSQLSGGYTVIEGWAQDVNGVGSAQVRQAGYRYENKAAGTKRDGAVMSTSWDYAVFPCGGLSYLVSSTIQPGSGGGSFGGLSNYSILPQKYVEDTVQNIPTSETWNILLIAKAPVRCKLVLGVDAGIGRTETVSIKLSADLQATNVLPDPTEVTETVTLDGADLNLPIDDEPPLSDPGAYNFFPTDRGLQALEHMICVGTAHLKNRARMVTVSWDTTFERALALSCRKNATIHDSRLPGGGGVATGKIIKYNFTASGSAMQFKGNVTIGCCVGKGGTVSASAGTPSIFVEGVVEPDLQTYTGSTIAIGSEITYTPPVYQAVEGELQFPLTKEQVLVSETIADGTTTVNIAGNASQFDTATVEGMRAWFEAALQNMRTTGSMTADVTVPTKTYRLELKSLDGTQDHIYDLTGTPLKLPKQIDLEAASWA